MKKTRAKPSQDTIDKRKRFGIDHPLWKGGRTKIGAYFTQRVYPDDFFYPMASHIGYVREHRLVMAKFLGRCLHSWEVIHHSNGIKTDNRIENLQLVTLDEHKQITELENRIKYLERRVSELEIEVNRGQAN